MKIEIDQTKCNGCGRCQTICHQNVIDIKQDNHAKFAFIADAPNCQQCGKCAGICPRGAVKFDGKNFKKRKKIRKFRRTGHTLLFIAVMAGVIAIVMLLWNALIPGIIGWNIINYWQSAGLIVLMRLLLGGFGHVAGKMNGRFGGHHGFHGGHGQPGHHNHDDPEFNAMHDRMHTMHDHFHKMSREERREHIRRFMHGCCDTEPGRERQAENTTE